MALEDNFISGKGKARRKARGKAPTISFPGVKSYLTTNNLIYFIAKIHFGGHFKNT